MTLIIVLSIIAALLAIAGYQLLVRKYYWGPGGPPGNSQQGQNDDKH